MSLESDLQGKSLLEQQKIILAAYQAAELPTDFVYDGIHIIISEIAYEDFNGSPDHPSLKVRAEAWVGEDRVNVDNPMNWIGILDYEAPDGTYSTVMQDDGSGDLIEVQLPNYIENIPLAFQIALTNCVKYHIEHRGFLK